MAESQGVEGTLQGGPRARLSPAHGRARQDAGGRQDPGRPREGRQEASRHGRDAHLADQARAGFDRRRARQVQGRGGDRRSSASAWRRRTSPVRTPNSASTPAACCPPSRRRAPSSARSPTPNASPRCSSAARSSIAPCSPPTSTKPKVAGIDCDPKQASEAAATLFTLQAGTKAFNANCVGGDKLAAQQLDRRAVRLCREVPVRQRAAEPADRRVAHQDQLRGDESRRQGAPLRRVLERVPGRQPPRLPGARHRHRHRLADLHDRPVRRQRRALAARRRAERARAATRQQLEAIIENALLPDTLDNARATLNAMRPITNASGFMAEVRPELLDPHTERQVLGVLNAGSTISAVDYDEAGGPLPRARRAVRVPVDRRQALVRSRQGQHRSRRAGEDRRRGAAARHQPERRDGAALHAPDRRGSRLHRRDQARARCSTSTSAPCARRSMPAPRSDACSARGKDASDFYIHRDLYKTLARIRARTLMADYGRAAHRRARQRHGERFGGSITERAKAIEHKPASASRRRRRPRSAAGFVTQLLSALNIEAQTLGARVRRRARGRHRRERGVQPRAASQRAARRAAAQARGRGAPGVRRGLHAAEEQAEAAGELGSCSCSTTPIRSSTSTGPC